jgi:hypothetical protein
MRQHETISLKKFAHDTKIGQIINDPSNSNELQATLNRLCDWAALWGMAFNVQSATFCT